LFRAVVQRVTLRYTHAQMLHAVRFGCPENRSLHCVPPVADLSQLLADDGLRVQVFPVAKAVNFRDHAFDR
jgi:hypothetical protein